MIKVLTFTSLFPNCIQPRHGVFVRNRLEQLINGGNVESMVVAPVPWFPFRNKIFGQYSQYARIPLSEEVNGIQVFHPRYINIPKIGMNLSPWLMTIGVKGLLKRIRENGYDFDLIDAHYFYPDGVAAAKLGKFFGRPVSITARGSDINVISKYRFPGRLILNTARKVSRIITVSQSLKDTIAGMGVPENKIQVLRNGIDLQKFIPPNDRSALRSSLGISGLTILSVGNLIELKGHHLIIEAIAGIPDARLQIIGQGPEENNLKNLVNRLGLQSRVDFPGYIPHEKLKDYYGASDLLVLASSSEGWANVLLESMACGTPVVATDVGGNSEVVKEKSAGIIILRTVDDIAAGIRQVTEHCRNRELTRAYAEKFSWEETTIAQEKIFSTMIKK